MSNVFKKVRHQSDTSKTRNSINHTNVAKICTLITKMNINLYNLIYSNMSFIKVNF